LTTDYWSVFILKTVIYDRDTIVYAGILASIGSLIHYTIWKPAPLLFSIAVIITNFIFSFRYDKSIFPSLSKKILLLFASASVLICFTSEFFECIYVIIPLILIGLITIYFNSSRCFFVVNMSLTIIFSFIVLESSFALFSWFVFDTTLLDWFLYPVVTLVEDTVKSPNALTLLDGRSSYLFHFTFENTHMIWGMRFIFVVFLLTVFLFPQELTLKRGIITLTRAIYVLLFWIVFSLVLWGMTKHPRCYLDITTEFIIEVIAILTLLPFAHRSFRPSRIHFRQEKFSIFHYGIIISVALFVIFCLWFPIGDRKTNLHILIDDSHSSWEKSIGSFDFSDKGLTREAAYSATSFTEYISHFYKIDVNNDQALDKIPLDHYGVLILKTPSKNFSKAEIDAVRTFVRNGGGLFLLGDHTNLFGISTHLNELIDDSGISFNLDDQATYNGQPSFFSRPCKLTCHPTIKEVPYFQFLTSCTLKPRTILIEPVIVSPRIISEDLRFGRPGFFGTMSYEPGDRSGAFLQAAVVPYGRGRIALFSDSTVMSNFSIFQGYYLEYFLDTIEYLFHFSTNKRQIILYASLICTLVSIIMLLFSIKKNNKIIYKSLDLFVVIIIGFVIGDIVFLVFLNQTVHYPEPQKPLHHIAIILGDASITNALSGTIHNNEELTKDFSGFLMAWQRAGYHPKVYDSIQKVPAIVDSIIYINPSKMLKYAEITDIKRRVAEHGTRLIVLTSPRQNIDVGNNILAPFSMFFAWQMNSEHSHPSLSIPNIQNNTNSVTIPTIAAIDYLVRGGNVPITSSKPIISTTLRFTINGGQTLILDKNAIPSLAFSQYGKGTVWACTNSTAYAGVDIGYSSITVPLTPEQKNNLQQRHSIIKTIMSTKPIQEILLDTNKELHFPQN
jgi:hypothetical protein